MNLLPNTTDFTGLDCHTHSIFSPDSAQTPEALVRAVRAKGLKGFIITDHVDIDRWGVDLDFAEYFRTWERVRKANPDLTIYIGLELGFEADTYKRAYRLVKDQPIEYLITSVHYVPNAWYEYDGGRVRSYTKYINAVLDSLDAPWEFNTVGHFGFFERYAPSPQSEWVMDYLTFAPLMDKVIEKALARRVLFEANTNSGCETFRLPRADFLTALNAAGGARPVLASDAHSPDRIGNRFDEAKIFLNEIFG